MKHFLSRIIKTIEDAPMTLNTWLVSFLAIVLGRLTIEHLFTHFDPQPTGYYFYHFTHEFFSFLATFLLALLVVRWAGKITLQKAAAFLTLGFLIIWTPPITDMILSHGKGFWSFYTFDSLIGLWHRYFTFFGDKPDIGTTYGIRVEIAIAILLVSLYGFLKSKSLQKTLLVSIVLYTILFSLGSSPAIVTIVTDGISKGFLNVTESDVVAKMISPTPLFGVAPPNLLSSLNVKMSLVFAVIDIILISVICFIFFRSYFIALWKNARFPQLVYHAGLFLLGGALTFTFTETTYMNDFFHILGVIVMIIAIECAWIASVIVNDFNDEKIDAITNKNRPLPTASIPIPLYKTFGILFFGASILLATLVSTQVAIILVVYQGVAWLYSSWPLRLKRFPIISTFLAAIDSLLIFFSGYIVFSLDKNISGLPWQIPLFLFVACILFLPIKDFKDIAGDKKDNVYTIPVLLGAKKAQLLIGSLMFLLYMFSPIILNAQSLFFPALLFGSFAFWAIQKGEEKSSSFFSFRKLPGITLAITALYGLVITFLLF